MLIDTEMDESTSWYKHLLLLFTNYNLVSVHDLFLRTSGAILKNIEKKTKN